MPALRVAALAISAALTGLSAAAPVHAGALERLVTSYHGYIPPCDSAWALRVISSRFGYTERRFWNSSAALSHFSHVREIAYRPWGPDYVPRRYCYAKVRASELHNTRVYYSIIEKSGFAGVGWGVEWCVVGYDRNLAYAPNCRAARP